MGPPAVQEPSREVRPEPTLDPLTHIHRTPICLNVEAPKSTLRDNWRERQDGAESSALAIRVTREYDGEGQIEGHDLAEPSSGSNRDDGTESVRVDLPTFLPQAAGNPFLQQRARAENLGLGTPFKVQWIKVAPLPFHRTRHLRNPWNHERRVKVSRDGIELEPCVGQALLDEWHQGEVL